MNSDNPAQSPGAATRILVIGSTATGRDRESARAKASAEAGLIRYLDQPAATNVVLTSLAGSDAAILCLNGDPFTPPARNVCLLAWLMHGELPVIQSPLSAAGAEIQHFSTSLGASGTVVVVPELPAAIEAAANRLADRTASLPFRLSISSAAGESRTVSGAAIAGLAKPGLDVVVMPDAIRAAVTSVAASDGGSGHHIELDRAVAVRSGQILAAADQRPELADQVAAHIAWLADAPLLPGRSYGLSLAGQSATAQISTLKHRINPANLDPIAARRLEPGEVGLCNVSLTAPLIFDQARGGLSRFTLEDTATGQTVGIGRILFTLRRATNIHWQALAIDKAARAALKRQRPCCLWFTGFSGSGKSTVASLLEKRLSAMNRHTYTLDGDNVRHGLNRDLGFTDADRVENIRRVAEVSKLFVDAGLIVMVSFISPFRAERDMARALFPAGEFLEIHVDTSIDICEQRDPKGLYKKARAGQLKNFTGIDSPYEPPEHAEIRLDSGRQTPETLVDQILRELARRGMVDLAD